MDIKMNYLDLILQSLDKFAKSFISIIPNVIIGILFILFTFLAARLISHIVVTLLPRMAVRSNLVSIIHKLTTLTVWFVGVLIIIAIVFPSVTTANLLATFGLTSVAIGLVFKNIFENFCAGILLLFREPFRIGDFIIVDKQQGYVTRVSVQNTHLRKTDGSRAYVPNSKMYTSTVQVLTDTKQRREKIGFSIDFNADLETARAVIKNAVEQCETVSKEKYIQIYVVSFSSNGIDFEVYWWTRPKPSDMRRSLDEVLTNIKKALDAEKIPMTYSTTLSLLEPVELKKREEKR